MQSIREHVQREKQEDVKIGEAWQEKAWRGKNRQGEARICKER
jgi:hypothetical protein